MAESVPKLRAVASGRGKDNTFAICQGHEVTHPTACLCGPTRLQHCSAHLRLLNTPRKHHV